MIYEGIFSVPIIQKAYKSYRSIFFLEKVKVHKVSCEGVGLLYGDRKYGLYSIKTITPMERPR